MTTQIDYARLADRVAPYLLRYLRTSTGGGGLSSSGLIPHDWNGPSHTGVPDEFPPEDHTHAGGDITSQVSDADTVDGYHAAALLDHGAQTGLADDDHTQYLLTSGDRAITGATASRLLATDASKKLASVANLASWIAGTSNRVTVTDDTDGTITLSAPQDLHTSAVPTFGGVVAAYVAPASNSTTAFQVRKADKSTAAINVDTTNSIFTSLYTLQIAGERSPKSGAGLEFQYSLGIGYMFAYDRDASTYMPFVLRGSYCEIRNATEVVLSSENGSVYLRSSTNATTGIQLRNSAGTAIVNVDTTNGRVGINKSSSIGSKLAVVGLTDYANNAAAITGGLSAGDFYTETGTNPKRVCVVY